MVFIQSLRNFIGSATGMSVFGGFFSMSSYVMYKDYSRFERMLAVYASGNILAPFEENCSEIAYLERPRVEDALARVISHDFTNQFYVVRGDVGCGKTRSIVELVRKKIRTTGASSKGAPIYIQVTQGASFPETLASAVSFNFDEHISHKFLMDFLMRVSSFPSQDNGSRLTRVLNAIEESSFIYMKQTGRPVILVIDGINFLESSMPGALKTLVEKAKLWADTNTVKMVFVSNSDETQDFMKRDLSCWSRAAEPITVGDLTRKEAIEFLTNGVYIENPNQSDHDVTCMKIDHSLASEMIDIVGGRMIHLIAFKRNYFAGISLKETLRQLKSHESEKFVSVSRKPAQWKVVAKLRDAPKKTLLLSKVIKSTSEEDVHALLRLRVLRIERHNSGAMLRFFSPLTEHVVDEMEKMFAIDLKQQEELLKLVENSQQKHLLHVSSRGGATAIAAAVGSITLIAVFKLIFR